MSELKDFLAKHRADLESLRARCPHPEKDIIIRMDSSGVGAGRLHPCIDVVCVNCGSKKIIVDDIPLKVVDVKRTLKKVGFKDERFTVIRYDWELER